MQLEYENPQEDEELFAECIKHGDAVTNRDQILIIT